MTVGLMQERLPFIRFETRPVEDRDASAKEGRYVAKDVHFVIIQPAGSKDTIEKRVDEWLASFKHPTQVELGRRYQELYELFKKGEELPVDGTPIKGWSAIGPAECAQLIAINVRTVEELANANDATLHRYGMGARALQERAKAWLRTVNDVGKVALLNNALQTENADLKARIKDLETELEGLRKNKDKAPTGRKTGTSDE